MFKKLSTCPKKLMYLADCLSSTCLSTSPVTHIIEWMAVEYKAANVTEILPYAQNAEHKNLFNSFRIEFIDF
jgi:hypothetical protein